MTLNVAVVHGSFITDRGSIPLMSHLSPECPGILIGSSGPSNLGGIIVWVSTFKRITYMIKRAAYMIIVAGMNHEISNIYSDFGTASIPNFE
jgi:hypothetical protein